MFEAHCVNVLFILLYNFYCVKASEQRTRSQRVNRDLRTKVMKGIKGLLGLVFVGILLKLNMLENLVGIWKRLKMFGSSELICCSGMFQENLKKSLLKLHVHVFSISRTNIPTNWVLALLEYPHLQTMIIYIERKSKAS